MFGTGDNHEKIHHKISHRNHRAILLCVGALLPHNLYQPYRDNHNKNRLDTYDDQGKRLESGLAYRADISPQQSVQNDEK